jgi:hypothetical protein
MFKGTLKTLNDLIWQHVRNKRIYRCLYWRGGGDKYRRQTQCTILSGRLGAFMRFNPRADDRQSRRDTAIMKISLGTG